MLKNLFSVIFKWKGSGETSSGKTHHRVQGESFKKERQDLGELL